MPIFVFDRKPGESLIACLRRQRREQPNTRSVIVEIYLQLREARRRAKAERKTILRLAFRKPKLRVLRGGRKKK
jgi:hypothetical protein